MKTDVVQAKVQVFGKADWQLLLTLGKLRKRKKIRLGDFIGWKTPPAVGADNGLLKQKRCRL
jgi:hypothetical protein